MLLYSKVFLPICQRTFSFSTPSNRSLSGMAPLPTGEACEVFLLRFHCLLTLLIKLLSCCFSASSGLDFRRGCKDKHFPFLHQISASLFAIFFSALTRKKSRWAGLSKPSPHLARKGRAKLAEAFEEAKPYKKNLQSMGASG